MDSSTTALRPQNKSQQDYVGILKQKELNKVPENSVVKQYTAQASKRGGENKDPNESTVKPVKEVKKLPGVSRLPVLAKLLQSAVTDASLNPAQTNWEERPLLGKAQKRKACTKPVPFNLSQSRNRSQKAVEASSELASKSRNLTVYLTRHMPAKTLSGSQHGTKARVTPQSTASGNKHTEHANRPITTSVCLSTKIHTTTAFKLPNKEKGCDDIVSVIQKDLSTKLGNITLEYSDLTKDGRFSSKASGFKDQAGCLPSTKQSQQTPVSGDYKTDVSERVGNAVTSCRTPRVSTCPSGQRVNVYLPQRVSVKKKKVYCGDKAVSENTMPFSPDPSSLRSILLNEGIKVRDPEGTTQRVSIYPSRTSVYSAQRVPVRKPQTVIAASVRESAVGTATFSPDPSAVKHGAVMTPRACLSVRPSSVYSAQRVPVKKAPSDASAAVLAGAVSFSPDPSALHSILHNDVVKAGSSVVDMLRVSVCTSRRGTTTPYTARRVPVKKIGAEEAHTGAGTSQTPFRKWTPQRVPASQSVRRQDSKYKKHLNITPGLAETQAPSMASSSQQEKEEVVQRLFQEDTEHERCVEMEDSGDEVTPGQSLQQLQSELKHKGGTDREANRSEKEKISAVQPFIQASHRMSVIVFSSGQKLLAQNAAQTASIQPLHHVTKLQPCTDQTSRAQSELDSQTDRPVTHGKQSKTKASSLSSAMCSLRRRLPPLEEMFLDEECAMYTSCQRSWPTQPRCYNPVASTLLFQDSTCFVPIIMTGPSLSPVPKLCLPVNA